MPRKSAAVLAAEQAAAVLAARPFADESTDPFAGRTEDEQRKVAESIASAKLAGASGNELRETFGPRLTGPARRKVLRTFGLDAGTIARSYDAYRDGDPREGSRHAIEHGARAEERRAAARSEAQQALAAAQAAPKGRSKASKAEHAERVAQAEQRLASIG